MNLAYQCFRLALASNNDHAEAYNNLGVLEMRKGHNEQVRMNGKFRQFLPLHSTVLLSIRVFVSNRLVHGCA